nr:2-hydroxy-3-oxopropionate reductase [Sinobaca sp. H24]
MNIGFIGLGIMGKPMALNLLKKGYNVTVFDINTTAVQELAGQGASAAFTPKETAAEKDIVITMLPQAVHVESVLFGPEGAAESLKAGSVVIDMSSISPVVSKSLSIRLSEQSIHMIDAPVSGGEPKAIDGTLAIMAGGEKSVFEQVYEVLEGMGEEITLVGDSGCGTTAKLANQIIVNVNIAAMSEGLVLAAKAGINIEKMYQAIRGGLAGSAVLDAKIPKILDRDFIAGGRIDINMKDLTNVMETAHALDTPLPLSSQVLEMFHAMKADGKAADDHGGLVQYYEKLAHTEVKRKEEL